MDWNKVVFHCFSENERNNGNQPSKWLGILYGHPYLQGKRAFERSFKATNLDRLMLETDSSYLSPIPKRTRK